MRDDTMPRVKVNYRKDGPETAGGEGLVYRMPRVPIVGETIRIVWPEGNEYVVRRVTLVAFSTGVHAGVAASMAMFDAEILVSWE